MRQAESIVEQEFARGEVEREFASPALIFKVAGQAMGARVSFNHKGPAETVTLVWSIAPGSIVPGVHQEDRSKWKEIARGTVPVTADIALINYVITISSVWPSTLPDAGLGFSWDQVDCRVEIFRDTTSLLMRWWDDVFSAVAAEFRDIEATFS